MDIATLIGMILVAALLAGSVIVGGGSFAAFWDLPSVLVVCGGCFASVLISFPLKRLLAAPMVVKKCLLNKGEDVPALISQLVSLAETARRDGLLALESRLEEIDNDFIKLGVQMAVDGSQPEVIEDVMRSAIDSLSARHADGKAVVDQAGRFAPAFGMIGTLMGLIMMLGNMSDPSGIGAGMAVALITTLYGAIISNGVFLPFAEKLGFLHKQELRSMEIAMRGIMAIQSGENPRVVEQKLKTFLAPKQRAGEGQAA
ncbi:MAG: motility protein A [Planctomycetes bacterium]|nr:motility protein A [Planctomycetota bacterium]